MCKLKVGCTKSQWGKVSADSMLRNKRLGVAQHVQMCAVRFCRLAVLSALCTAFQDFLVSCCHRTVCCVRRVRWLQLVLLHLLHYAGNHVN